MEENEITGIIIDAALRLHIALGPGLLESVYELALAHSLERRGLAVERQVAVGFEYDGMRFDDAFRVDLLVEGCIVVELKSVECLQGVHYKQLLTYVRLLDKRHGLLLNFGQFRLKDGIRRIINSEKASPDPRP